MPLKWVVILSEAKDLCNRGDRRCRRVQRSFGPQKSAGLRMTGELGTGAPRRQRTLDRNCSRPRRLDGHLRFHLQEQAFHPPHHNGLTC